MASAEHHRSRAAKPLGAVHQSTATARRWPEPTPPSCGSCVLGAVLGSALAQGSDYGLGPAPTAIYHRLKSQLLPALARVRRRGAGKVIRGLLLRRAEPRTGLELLFGLSQRLRPVFPLHAAWNFEPRGDMVATDRLCWLYALGTSH
jgi:hypothetical protein